jgi:hypothetical protein
MQLCFKFCTQSKQAPLSHMHSDTHTQYNITLFPNINLVDICIALATVIVTSKLELWRKEIYRNLCILVGFGLACAPVRCAHPSFFGLINMQNGALRAPPARRSFAASFTVFTPQTFPSGPNLGHQGC